MLSLKLLILSLAKPVIGRILKEILEEILTGILKKIKEKIVEGKMKVSKTAPEGKISLEIIFVGRSNVGKSSLLRELFGAKVKVGKRPGVTLRPIHAQIS